MLRLAVAVSALVLAGIVGAAELNAARFDASSGKAFKSSLQAAKQDLSPENLERLGGALKHIWNDGTKTAEADGRKSEVEGRIARQVKTMVEGMVGAGKARVNVTADLNLARVTVQQETFDPDGQVVRSETTNEESARENQPENDVGASASSNIPGGAVGADGAALNQSASGRHESRPIA